MNIEDKIEIEANKLLDKYYPFYYKRYHRNKYQIKAKFMPYFISAAKLFCVREGYDAEKLIESFMLDGFKFPTQLPNELVWKTYINYAPAIQNKKSEEIEIVENIVNAAIEIKRAGSVKEWLNKKINQKMVIEDKLKFNPLLLAFSTTFLDFCKKECYDTYNPEYMRRLVLSQKSSEKILAKIKDVLKSDYYLFDEELQKELDEKGIVF